MAYISVRRCKKAMIAGGESRINKQLAKEVSPEARLLQAIFGVESPKMRARLARQRKAADAARNKPAVRRAIEARHRARRQAQLARLDELCP